jgi:hypothetical protein
MIVGLRRMIRGAYVAPDLVAMGLDTPNPKEPTAFLRKSELALDKLGDDDRLRMLGKALFRSPQDPKVHCEELRPEIRDLRTTLKELVKVRRRTGGGGTRRRGDAGEAPLPDGSSEPGLVARRLAAGS